MSLDESTLSYTATSSRSPLQPPNKVGVSSKMIRSVPVDPVDAPLIYRVTVPLSARLKARCVQTPGES